MWVYQTLPLRIVNHLENEVSVWQAVDVWREVLLSATRSLTLPPGLRNFDELDTGTKDTRIGADLSLS